MKIMSPMNEHPVLVHIDSASDHHDDGACALTTQHAQSVGAFIEIKAAKSAATDFRESTEPSITVVPVRANANTDPLSRITIGRSRGNDLVIPYPKISKFHAYLTQRGESAHYALHDAGATNGTFIDDTPLIPHTPYPLSDGCTIKLGPYRYRFLLPNSPLRASMGA